MAKHEIYISADIEADGPIPGPYSMSSFGFAVAAVRDGDGFRRRDPAESTFYAELRPISDNFVPDAAAVAGFDRDELRRSGTEPVNAMKDAARWVAGVANGYRPVMVAYPAVFDWMWLQWYFVNFTGACPFGFSNCLDMKTLYMAKAGTMFTDSVRQNMQDFLQSDRPHTHNALDDAMEQADVFCNLYEWPGNSFPPRLDST